MVIAIEGVERVSEGQAKVSTDGTVLRTNPNMGCGVVVYDRQNRVGLAHARTPDETRSLVGRLVETMLSRGARQENLRAAICGCKPLGHGPANAEAAKAALKASGVPVEIDDSGVCFQTDVTVRPDYLALVLEEPELRPGYSQPREYSLTY
jgi:chemotaxis receptor (MCP) glutamine deamidase CheD